MKVGVLIGRFQLPEPHEGHRFLINSILDNCDRLIILIGSSNRARSVRNPWTFRERAEAMQRIFPDVEVQPLNDYLYNDSQWMADVSATIENSVDNTDEVILFGHAKDGNDYLDWFPQYKFQNVPSDIEISGTEIRNTLFDTKHMPDSVRADAAYYAKELVKFRDYPYPGSLNVNCGDAILECNGHIALIRRKRAPGAGTWALPGGHKHDNETFQDCALRELEEETLIKLPRKVLVGSIVRRRLFDSPARSHGGITRSTLGVYIRVAANPDGSMPKLKAADDAAEVQWFSIHDALNLLATYDDHGDIISTLTGVQPLPAYLNRHVWER